MTLKLCSLAARGLWIEMLAIMGISERIGYLQIGGKAITCDQLAVMAGVKPEEAEHLMQELEDNGVFSRDENGIPYCRRMVRDVIKYEQDQTNGRKGGNPTLKNPESGIQNPKATIQNSEATDGLSHGLTPSGDLENWKDSFEVYKQQELTAYRELIQDAEWLAERKRLNPRLDVMLSLEKAHIEFWATEAGWKHKKSRKAKTINWKATYVSALSLKCNRVWLPTPRDSTIPSVKAKVQKQQDRNEIIEMMVDKLWALKKADNDEEFKRQLSVARNKYHKEYGNNAKGQSIIDEVLEIIKFRQEKGWE